MGWEVIIITQKINVMKLFSEPISNQAFPDEKVFEWTLRGLDPFAIAVIHFNKKRQTSQQKTKWLVPFFHCTPLLKLARVSPFLRKQIKIGTLVLIDECVGMS